MSSVKKCKGCCADIYWIEMNSGKYMPVDKGPEKRVVIKDGKGFLLDTYMPHWSTCPAAEKFKKEG